MEPSYKNSFSGKGVFPPRYAFTLLIPFRNFFLSPKTLLQRLHLKDDQVVLEIGPGPGYFSTHVARKLASGRLVLLDIQQEMLDYARRRLKKRKLENVDYVLTDGNCFTLENGRFDRIFMVTVIGEVDHKRQYLEEIWRVLKADGIVSVTELAGDPDKISMDEMKILFENHSFELVESFGSRRNYTLNFSKAEKALLP